MGKIEKCLDWIVKTVTGYGAKNKRVLWILFSVIMLGAISFGFADVAPNAPDRGKPVTVRKAIYYVAYATDIIIPVSLGLDDKDNFSSKVEKHNYCISSEERCLFIELFHSFYILLGWLLIPLAVMSITGFLTKKEK